MCLITDAKGDVRVHCGWVFEDSFVENMCPWPDDHSKRLVVNFEGEDVLNYGGVSREWFFFLKHTIFYPSSASQYTTTIHYRSTWLGASTPTILNSSATSSAHHWQLGRFLCAHFVPGFSKVVLNRETNPKDLEVVNNGLYKGLIRILCVLIVVQGHAAHHGHCN
ncbi:hypothetical protein EDB85DRAFT_1415416 [Lactarius pseudohatsudake]|nr:hypothetical protein EDB85DRAFT_1415416 [Lactarius pseudohatsudake]